MHLKGLELKNYRNYAHMNLKLGKGLNIFIGENAQGKTNIAEAIYFLSSLKSHRTSRDKELIFWGKDKAYIRGELHKSGGGREGDHTIEFLLSDKEKRACKINGIRYGKASEIFGFVNVVIFSPEDLRLVKDGPGIRRRFIDNELNQLRPKYHYLLNQYNHVLQQRNSLLKNIRRSPSLKLTAEVFSEQLADYGSQICHIRNEFIKKIALISRLIHRKITEGREELELSYVYSDGEFIDLSSSKERLLRYYIEDIEEDAEKGFTMKGPHRDDIMIKLNGIDAKTFGSQGQQRTAALSLKLSELEIIKSEVQEYPILILDDVLSELDVRRQKYLLTTLKEIQTILTCTSLNDINEFHFEDKNIFHVEDGNII